MSIYRVNPISGGIGFKVYVAECSDAVRVVGVFPTEAAAKDWIATHRVELEKFDEQTPQMLARQE